MRAATRFQTSATSGDQPWPETFERFMETYWHLPGHHRLRLFQAMPAEYQDACWRALRAQLDAVQGES